MMTPRSMIRRLRTFLLCAAIALPAATAAGETPPIAEILARHAEALGGADRAAIGSMKVLGSFNFNGIDSPYTIYRQRPDRFRIEIETARGTVVTAFDGETAWSRSPDRSGEMRLRTMEGENRQSLIDETADFDDPLVDCEKKGHKVELAGEEDVDGVATYHLKLTLAGGGVQEWFLSKDDHQAVRKITTGVHRRAGPYQRVFYMMEHETTAGVSLPRYVEREDRQHVRAYTVEQVEVGAQIAPGLFEMPAAAPEGN